jgi:hypothetical protein
MLCGLRRFVSSKPVSLRLRLVFSTTTIARFLSSPVFALLETPKAPKAGKKRGKKIGSKNPRSQTLLSRYPLLLRRQLQTSRTSDCRFEERGAGMGSGSLLKVLAKNFDVLAGSVFFPIPFAIFY